MFRRGSGAPALAGVQLMPVSVPEAAEQDALFARLLPAEWLAFFGRERFIAHRREIDPVVQARASVGLNVAADEYVVSTDAGCN